MTLLNDAIQDDMVAAVYEEGEPPQVLSARREALFRAGAERGRI